MHEPRALPSPREILRFLCGLVIRLVRDRRPDLFPTPDAPAETGRPGPEVRLDETSVQTLVRAAAETSAGGRTLLWDDGERQLRVHVAEMTTGLEDGLIVVGIPVECDQADRALIEVSFAVGSEKRPAGLLAATGTRPTGPPEIVDVWSEALTAVAWQALTQMAAGLAAESGGDGDGAGLVPLGLTARGRELRLATLAPHSLDREPA